MDQITVIYHNDADGFAAALVVKEFYEAQTRRRSTLTFLAAQYGDRPPAAFAGHDLYILDFSFSREIIEEIKSRCKNLVLIDHHETAEAALKGLEYCHIDTTKAGCVLTWEYIYPGKPVPALLQYVQDRDLWAWKLPDSRKINAAIRSHSFDFELWGSWLKHDEYYTEVLTIDGTAILRDQQRYIDSKVEHVKNSRNGAYMAEIAGYIVPCINNTHLISEVGEALCKITPGYPLAISFFDVPDKRVFSLRSPKGGAHVGMIAKEFGGGGHARAAGFTVPLRMSPITAGGGKE